MDRWAKFVGTSGSESLRLTLLPLISCPKRCRSRCSSGGSSAEIRIPPARPANSEGVAAARGGKVLATLLDELASASARGRRGNLALVRTMTEKGNENG